MNCFVVCVILRNLVGVWVDVVVNIFDFCIVVWGCFDECVLFVWFDYRGVCCGLIIGGCMLEQLVCVW